MTNKQRREYKAGNQKRKKQILLNAHRADPRERGYWAKTIGVIQDGKYTGRTLL